MRLLLKAAQPVGVMSVRCGQYFDRHVAPQPFITRAIHYPHPATPQQRQDFVCSDALSGEQLRRRLSKLSRIKPPRLKRQRVVFDKALSRPVKAQQLFDLAAQVGVARTGLSEKPLARVRLAFQRRVIKLFNLFPTFRFHPASPRAAFSAATTWPNASRDEPSRPKPPGPRRSLPR